MVFESRGKNMTFYDWLFEYQDTQFPIGYLAKCIYNDPKFPRHITKWDSLTKYLNSDKNHISFNLTDVKRAFNYYLIDAQAFENLNKQKRLA